jgi:hypothetical protein
MPEHEMYRMEMSLSQAATQSLQGFARRPPQRERARHLLARTDAAVAACMGIAFAFEMPIIPTLSGCVGAKGGR